MKVRFCCDSGVNIRFCKKSDWMDTVKDLANNHLEIYYGERK